MDPMRSLRLQLLIMFGTGTLAIAAGVLSARRRERSGWRQFFLVIVISVALSNAVSTWVFDLVRAPGVDGMGVPYPYEFLPRDGLIVGLLTGLTAGIAAVGARRIFRHDPPPAGQCPTCGYNLTGAPHERCPECGEAVCSPGRR